MVSKVLVLDWESICNSFCGFISSGESPSGYFPERYARPMPFLCHGYPLGRGIAWRAFTARDGRDSPLKYTASDSARSSHASARDGRDSPLKYTSIDRQRCRADARDGRDSPLKYTHALMHRRGNVLGMAGIHRSSTLAIMSHCLQRRLGMAGIHRSSTLGIMQVPRSSRARDGRDSPLKYTSRSSGRLLWPRMMR